MKKILVIGGLGYVGTQLVPKLIEKNYIVSVYDLGIYGCHLKPHSKLKVIKGDIRNINKLNEVMKNHDIVIHLACISNDPSFELNPKLGKSINFDSFEPLVLSAKRNGVKKFIFASSSSVYGVKETKDVTEEASLDPLTDYSKFKMQCEDVLLSQTNNNFLGCVTRPATVCGYSPRQRLDLVVNILTNFAFHKKKIKIFGGKQLRPNIHISDMVESYLVLIRSAENKIKDQVFNIGFENYSVETLAKMVKDNIGSEVVLEFNKSDDNRSYHINSKKISNILGFKPKKSIDFAIKDLISAFKEKKLFNTFDNDEYFNIKKMQKLNLS